MIKKPLLAGTCDLTKVKYPVFVSPKLDGIRCLVINGKCLSRTFKPIPNDYVRTTIEAHYSNFVGVLDGELIIEDKQFNEISSAIMSKEGCPDFRYVVFDVVTDLTKPYEYRLGNLSTLKTTPWLKVVETYAVSSQPELEDYDLRFLEQGYEGTMVRSFSGFYKEGRSTTKEGILLKLKQFTDDEATVVGFEEQRLNQNEVQTNDARKNYRAKVRSNMIPKDTLGALVVVTKTGIEFKVSAGFTEDLRKTIWDNKSEYIGKLVKYRYQGHGTVVKPRCPVFVGFRHEDDL